jgi:hypothetical protein
MSAVLLRSTFYFILNEVESKNSGHMIVDEELGKYRQVVKKIMDNLKIQILYHL